MSSSLSWPSRLAWVAASCLAILPRVSASVEYCSTINTSIMSRNVSMWQSNGLCELFCQATYAFAVVQDNGCWCSNYAPATNTSGCTTTCPGYPPELCGGNGVYGYIPLANAVLGTQGAASSSTATQQQVTVTEAAEPQTIVPEPQTVTVTPSFVEPTTSSSSTAALQSGTTSRTTSRTSPDTSSTWTPTPITSLETVTGQVRTVTVTPTVPPNAASTASVQKSSKGSSGLSTGAAVGLTIGLVALVAIISSIVYFCWRRRQKEKNAEYNDVSVRQSGAGFPPVVPSRSMSESSRYVLNTDGRQVVESWEGENDAGSRRSRMATVDPRLDPFARVYQRAADSKSRESVNTLRDDQDYSRRIRQQGQILRATNPDPHNSMDL